MRFNRFLTFSLALICIFTLCFSGCKKEEEPVESEPSPQVRQITVYKKGVIVNYKTIDGEAYYRTDVWDGLERFIYKKEETRNYSTKIWITPDDPRYDSEETNFEEEYEQYDQTLALYPSVVAWLESGDPVEREFYLRPCGMEYIYIDDYIRRDAFFEDWAKAVLPAKGLPKVIPRVGFISWWGTHEDLLALRDVTGLIDVCLPTDFEEIFEVTVEQAQVMIDAGELNIWSCPKTSYPYYPG